MENRTSKITCFHNALHFRRLQERKPLCCLYAKFLVDLIVTPLKFGDSNDLYSPQQEIQPGVEIAMHKSPYIVT